MEDIEFNRLNFDTDKFLTRDDLHGNHWGLILVPVIHQNSDFIISKSFIRAWSYMTQWQCLGLQQYIICISGITFTAVIIISRAYIIHINMFQSGKRKKKSNWSIIFQNVLSLFSTCLSTLKKGLKGMVYWLGYHFPTF